MGTATHRVAIATTAATPAGTYYFRITVDGTQSNVATLTISAPIPVLTGNVTINNTSPRVGDTITATYTGGNGTGAATWQWLRGETLITGATSSTYTVVAADLGARLRARVSYANQSGSITSAETAVVAAVKTVTVGTQTIAMHAGVAGSVAQFNVNTTGITIGTYAATISGNPNTVSVQGSVTINGAGAGTLTLVGTAATTASTYPVMRLTIDGTQSGNFTLTITRPDPTNIVFTSPAIYYTYPGRVFDIGYTLTPSGADPSKITWTQDGNYHPYTQAVIVSTGSTSASVSTRTTGGGQDGVISSYRSTITLTANLPNGTTRSVEINSRLFMRTATATTFATSVSSVFYESSLLELRRGVNETRYFRAYHSVNATQWASAASPYNPQGQQTILANTEYTLTSSDPDITVSRMGDGETWQITRTSASVSKDITLTATFGSGATARTYTQTARLRD